MSSKTKLDLSLTVTEQAAPASAGRAATTAWDTRMGT
jgi:hypothetical protein